jgi:hypothetical protein
MDIQKGHSDEEHDIRILTEERCVEIKRYLNYWRELSMVSKDKSEKEWKVCTEL